MSSTMPYKITKTDAEWQSLLKDKGAEPMAYQVTRHEATERAFTGRLAEQHAAGTYRCICCDKPLFDAAAKFDDGHAIVIEAAAVKMCDPNVVNVIETVCSTLQLWEFPPCSASRPFERPSATSFGDSIGKLNERFQ